MSVRIVGVVDVQANVLCKFSENSMVFVFLFYKHSSFLKACTAFYSWAALVVAINLDFFGLHCRLFSPIQSRQCPNWLNWSSIFLGCVELLLFLVTNRVVVFPQ